MYSDFWFGISAGVLLGTIIMGLAFAVINDNRVFLKEKEWNCTQSRIIDPKNVDKTECIVYVRSDAK